MRRLLAPLALGQLLLVSVGCAKSPKVVSAKEVPQAIAALKALGGHVSYEGLAYFQDRLYVATTFGVLELRGHEIDRLTQFPGRDAVVNGLWLDRSQSALWVQDSEEDFHLLRESGWKTVPLPQGDFTRGDFLHGFKIASGAAGIWMYGAGRGWRYDPGKGWSSESAPPGGGKVIRVIPLEEGLVWVLKPGPPEILKAAEGGDTAALERIKNLKSELAADPTFGQNSAPMMFFSKTWEPIPNSSPHPVLPVDVAVLGKVAYACTRRGDVVRIERSGVSEVISPGSCDAITGSDRGTAVASFGASGIQELTATGWRLLVPPPESVALGAHRAYLAVKGDDIAFATTGMHEPTGATFPGDIKATTGLWVRSGQRLVPVDPAPIP